MSVLACSKTACSAASRLGKRPPDAKSLYVSGSRFKHFCICLNKGVVVLRWNFNFVILVRVVHEVPPLRNFEPLVFTCNACTPVDSILLSLEALAVCRAWKILLPLKMADN